MYWSGSMKNEESARAIITSIEIQKYMTYLIVPCQELSAVIRRPDNMKKGERKMSETKVLNIYRLIALTKGGKDFSNTITIEMIKKRFLS